MYVSLNDFEEIPDRITSFTWPHFTIFAHEL